MNIKLKIHCHVNQDSKKIMIKSFIEDLNCIEQLNVIKRDAFLKKCGQVLNILNKCYTAIGRRL